MSLSYKTLSLSDVDESLWQSAFSLRYFEHTLAWLKATEQHMVQNKCLLHTLWKHEKLSVALPLVHHKKYSTFVKLASLTSFYSCQSSVLVRAGEEHLVRHLLNEIKAKYQFDLLELGPMLTQDFHLLSEFCKPHHVIGESVNWFESNISSEIDYIEKRPSRLKNTLKRKRKALVNAHKFHTEFANDSSSFQKLMADFFTIYEKSWKSSEFSNAFIEQVSQEALSDNKLVLAILYVDGQPAAGQLWFIQGTNASIFKLAYDPLFKKQSVGSLLSEDISRYVITHRKVDYIDFGMGDEDYKKNWMSYYQLRNTYLLFNTEHWKGKLAWVRYYILPQFKSLIYSWIWKTKNES